MRSLEVITAILATVLAMTWLARRLRWNEPVLLVAGGCLIGLTPGFRTLVLPPPVVLLLFLPPLLYWESLTTSLREIRTNLRGIVLLATGLVLATAAAVAGVGHALGLSGRSPSSWAPSWPPRTPSLCRRSPGSCPAGSRPSSGRRA
ncbi:cation:proton antiporter [Streptomyces mirabilis]|nr:cation:proton antiporter [Streptomyces mirabilis]